MNAKSDVEAKRQAIQDELIRLGVGIDDDSSEDAVRKFNKAAKEFNKLLRKHTGQS
jgi:hypothetical protein